MAIITTPRVSTSTPAPQEQRHHDDGEAVRQAVDRAMNAIEALFALSPNPELSRLGLLDIMDYLAGKRQTPAEAVQTLIDEHELQVEEWDTSTLDERLRDRLMGFYGEVDGKNVIVVPAGQDPAERLHAIRALLVHQGAL